MHKIDKELKNYIWENIESLKSLFSQKRSQLIFGILFDMKKNNEKQDFMSFINLISDDENLIKNLKSNLNSIDYMGIQEITKHLKISSNELFLDKKKYLKRALYLIENNKSKDVDFSSLLNNLAELYIIMSDYKKALELFEESIKIRKEKLGEEDILTSESYNNLGKLFRITGEYKKALPFIKKAISIREKNLGEEDILTLESYNNLANHYRLIGEYNDAYPLFEKALKISKKILGDDDVVTAKYSTDLAFYYTRIGKYEDASLLYENALEIQESKLGENHPDTIKSYNYLGFNYTLVKNYKRSYLILEKAIGLSKKTYGENNVQTAELYNDLSGLYRYYDEININEALIVIKKSIKIMKKIFEHNHPKLASMYNNLAGIYKSKGDYTKAEKEYIKAIEIFQGILGEEHPETALLYHNLAENYRLSKHNNKAIDLYNKALKIAEKVNHPNIDIIHKNANRAMVNMNKLFFTNGQNSNFNLKINAISIKGFKLFNEFEMKFTEKINIIIGQNSSGKTSLLQAITLGLMKNDSFDLDALGGSYSKYVAKDRDISEIKIIYNNNNSEKIIELYKNERKVKDNYFIPFLLSYGSNFFTKYNIDAGETVDEIMNETIHEYFVDSIFLDYTDGFWNPLGILKYLHLKGEVKKKQIIFDTINQFLETFQLVENKGDYYFLKGENTTPLDLENLSEGYRSNVLLITDILINILGVGYTPDTIEGIVMIDEFDKHLHPRWQSRLVTQLSKTFPNIQFILSTHNPMSILDRESDEITVIEENETGFQAVKKEVGTKKIGVSTILLEYFGVESTVSETMQKKLKTFTELKLKDTLNSKDKEELQNLENFLDETVATNFIYNKAYFKFLKFLKNNKNINFEDYEEMSEKEMQQLLNEFKDLFE